MECMKMFIPLKGASTLESLETLMVATLFTPMDVFASLEMSRYCRLFVLVDFVGSQSVVGV
jgi:hypothetical protein